MTDLSFLCRRSRNGYIYPTALDLFIWTCIIALAPFDACKNYFNRNNFISKLKIKKKHIEVHLTRWSLVYAGWNDEVAWNMAKLSGIKWHLWDWIILCTNIWQYILEIIVKMLRRVFPTQYIFWCSLVALMGIIKLLNLDDKEVII